MGPKIEPCGTPRVDVNDPDRGDVPIIDLCHAAAICFRRFKKLCLCTPSLVLSTRLAVHIQSFLNLLRQNGRRVTKAYEKYFLLLVQLKILNVDKTASK